MTHTFTKKGVAAVTSTWMIASSFFAPFVAFPESVSATEVTPVAYTCTLEPLPGRTIVEFNGGKLYSNRTLGESFDTTAVSLPVGTYSITLETYDGNPKRSEDKAQPFESWFVALEDGNGVVLESSITPDLLDGVNFVDSRDLVETAISLPTAITMVTATHAFYPNALTGATTVNSLDPICAAFDLVVENPENVKPEITVVGDNPVIINEGEVYSDAGATAQDTEDGDITGDIIVGGDTVDTNVPGTYTITYNVADSEGLLADQKSRLVLVKDIHTSSCLIPNTDGDSVSDTLGTSNEPTLQSILDGEGYTLDALLDTTEIQGWDATHDNVTVALEFITRSASTNPLAHGVVGYVTDKDASSFAPLFQKGAHPLYTVGDLLPGSQSIVTFNGGDTLGFALDSEIGGEYFFSSTHNTLTDNGGSDRARVYHVGDNEYVIAFEDVTHEASDRDYNDMVIKMSVLGCENTVINEKPVINLLGTNPITLEEGTSYTDAGATAQDTEDGDITGDIIVGGDTVDTNVPGTYTITYNVTDSQGLAADSVTRTVVVTRAPVACMIEGYKYDAETLVGISGWTVGLGQFVPSEAESSFADSVVSYSEGALEDASGVLGSADSAGITLMAGDELVVKFETLISNGTGNDIALIEGSSCTTPVTASFSQDGISWMTLGSGCEFDLGSYSWAQYIRVVGISGEVEIDAFEAYYPQVLESITETTTLSDGYYCLGDVTGGTYALYEKTTDTASPVEAVVQGLTVTPFETNNNAFVEVTLSGDTTLEADFYNLIRTPYAPYCGDGIVNQAWEQCDGSESCTRCQISPLPQCTETVLAQVVVDTVSNYYNGNASSDIYLGGTTNRIPSGAWFPLALDGSYVTDSEMVSSGYENVPGLALERSEGKIRLVLFGGHGQDGSKEHVEGTISLWNVDLTDVTSDTSGNNKIENGFNNAKEEVPNEDELTPDYTENTVDFWLTVTSADDGFYTHYSDLPQCTLNEKPVINLLGTNPITLEEGTTYTDAGATALDTEDGDITGDIIVGGDTVDTSVPGTYTLTYNVTDSQGLAADSVTRTVVVTPRDGEVYLCSDGSDNDTDGLIDTLDPGCHTDGDAGNPDSYDPKDNDETNEVVVNQKPVITLIGESTVVISLGNGYNDQGATAEDTEDGNITANIVVVSTVSPSVAGTYTVTYNVSDSDGLAADSVTRTVQVVAPSTPPGGGGGGGGGILSINLEIFNEKIVQLSPDTALITWNTNSPATSQVGYGTFPVPLATIAQVQKYGYENITLEYLTYNQAHSVFVTGLVPGEAYFFRPSSDNSNADRVIGRELSFQTIQEIQSCFYLRDFLRIDLENNPVEVRKLQTFLNTFEGYNLDVDGVFDQEVEDAVDAFQTKYNNDVLNPWGYGDYEPTGYVYLTTRKKINEIYCQRAFPLDSAQQSEVEAFNALLETLNPEERSSISLPHVGQVTPPPTDVIVRGDSDVSSNKALTDATDSQVDTTQSNLAVSFLSRLQGNDDTNTGTTSTTTKQRSKFGLFAASVYSAIDALVDTILKK